MAPSSTFVSGIGSKIPFLDKLPMGIGDRISPPDSNDKVQDPTQTAVSLIQTSEQEKLNKKMAAMLLTNNWQNGFSLGQKAML